MATSKTRRDQRKKKTKKTRDYMGPDKKKKKTPNWLKEDKPRKKKPKTAPKPNKPGQRTTKKTKPKTWTLKDGTKKKTDARKKK